MASENSTRSAISAIDIDSARIELSAAEVLGAIANAIEVLSAITPPPENLFSHTIPRLAGHAVYLAGALGNEMHGFIEQVEASMEVPA